MDDTGSQMPADAQAMQQMRELHNEVSQHLLELFDWSQFGNVTDPYNLDLAEEALSHQVRAEPCGALTFYSHRQFLGGYQHLAWRLADYRRGLRITELLVDGLGIDPECPYPVSPWYERCLFHLDLGHAALAESQLRELLQQMNADTPARWYAQQVSHYSEALAAAYYKGMLLQCLADALIAQGRLPEAERAANEALDLVGEQASGEGVRPLRVDTGANPYGRRAVARSLLGKTEDALADFQAATADDDRRSDNRSTSRVYGRDTMEHAVLLARLGRLKSARRVLSGYRTDAGQELRPLLDAHYRLARAEIELVAGSDGEAVGPVMQAFDWSRRSGHLETHLKSSLLWARLQLRVAQPAEARQILQEIILAARAAEYRICLAEGLVLAGHGELQAENRDGALTYALEAIDICAAEQVVYPWGLGNALHLAAEVSYRAGDNTNAISYATRAIEVRQAIGDPKIANTRRIMTANI